MTNRFLRLLAEKPFLMADGATGTNLFQVGLQAGDAPEMWNFDHVERIEALHKGFVDAGADIVTIHAEATDDPRPILEQIRNRGALASLAINPPTPIEAIADALPLCDMVLCMSVMPGFGAQAFESVALEKLRALRSIRSDLLLEIDGGVNAKTIAECTAAGAQMLVVGSAIFKSQTPYAESLAELTRLAASGPQ